VAHNYINEIDHLFHEYLSGNTQILHSLSLNMLKYVELEKNHIKIVENVVLPLCERIFNSDKLKSIAIDFKNIQNHNVGHLKYQEYYKLLAMLKAENAVFSENVYY
jgi:hemerythrin-like domain-containing protein